MCYFFSIWLRHCRRQLVGKELTKLTSVLIFRENNQLFNQNALTIAAADGTVSNIGANRNISAHRSEYFTLTHLSQIDFPIPINSTSPFPF